MNSLAWSPVPLAHAFSERVPAQPGLYVIAAAKRAAGLPLMLEPVYAGRTRNLQRRLQEHSSPWREHNSALAEAALRQQLEFWFAEAPADELIHLEQLLIRLTQPIANRTRY